MGFNVKISLKDECNQKWKFSRYLVLMESQVKFCRQQTFLNFRNKMLLQRSSTHWSGCRTCFKLLKTTKTKTKTKSPESQTLTDIIIPFQTEICTESCWAISDSMHRVRRRCANSALRRRCKSCLLKNKFVLSGLRGLHISCLGEWCNTVPKNVELFL